MNGLPYYKAYPRDFIEGTIGMPFEVKGAYRLVLDLIYMQGGNLPDDARYISGLLGCTIRKWKSLRDELLQDGKLELNGEFLTNKRAVSELKILAKLQENQRENRSRPNKNNGIATPPLNHTEPEPEPKVKEEPKGSYKRTGNRLAANWVPSEADIAFAASIGMRPDAIRREADQFRDYWISKTGKDATKLDWEATWRGWVRRAHSRTTGPPGKPRMTKFQETQDRARRALNEALGIRDDEQHSDFDNGNVIDLGRANYRG